MTTSLLKIETIIRGTAQLFTSMDKGFAKVESDLVLISRFRQICYDANGGLLAALPMLQSHTKSVGEYETIELFIDAKGKDIIKDLYCLKDIIGGNIIALSAYIDGFDELWKRSFSLSALLKFRALLINEYSLLEKEIDTLEMEITGIERMKRINLHNPAFKGVAESTGLNFK